MLQFINTIITNTKQYWLLICTIIIVLITSLSLTPLPHLPMVPGSDKIHHFIAYAGLFFPVALAKPKYWLSIGIFFIVVSGTIELIQPYVNRYGEWLDLLSNSAGILCGYLLAKMTNSLSDKITQTSNVVNMYKENSK